MCCLRLDSYCMQETFHSLSMISYLHDNVPALAQLLLRIRAGNGLHGSLQALRNILILALLERLLKGAEGYCDRWRQLHNVRELPTHACTHQDGEWRADS